MPTRKPRKNAARPRRSAAHPEPVFVLRAQDQLAPEIVREWAYRAKQQRVNEKKVSEARRIADQMEDWQIKERKKKLPD